MKHNKKKCQECEVSKATHGNLCKDCYNIILREQAEEEMMYGPREDVYEHMSARDQEMNDRLDYAREVEQAGDPERAAEIRMGA